MNAWLADIACPVVCQPFWPACWLDTPDRSPSSSTCVVQDVWDVYRDELGVVPEVVVLAPQGRLWMIFVYLESSRRSWFISGLL